MTASCGDSLITGGRDFAQGYTVVNWKRDFSKYRFERGRDVAFSGEDISQQAASQSVSEVKLK